MLSPFPPLPLSHSLEMMVVVSCCFLPECTFPAANVRHPFHQSRYLKRGISVHGKVANDCEVEQILQLDSGVAAQFCSYLQMRGSIPTYWWVFVPMAPCCCH